MGWVVSVPPRCPPPAGHLLGGAWLEGDGCLEVRPIIGPKGNSLWCPELLFWSPVDGRGCLISGKLQRLRVEPGRILGLQELWSQESTGHPASGVQMDVQLDRRTDAGGAGVCLMSVLLV